MTRREKALLVALPVLLAVAIIANLGNIMDLIHGRRTLREIIIGREVRNPAPPKEAIGEIKPLGPKDAKVKVTGYLIFTNPCHWGTVRLLRGLASKFPGKVRVEFVNLGTEEGAKRFAEDSKKGFEKGHPPHSCMAWIAVDGKFEFEVVQKGRKQKIQFSGAIQPGDPLAKVLERIVAEKIRKAYGEKGKKSPKGADRKDLP